MSVKRVWAPDAEPLDRVVVVLSRVSAVRIRSTATRGVRAEDVAGCRALGASASCRWPCTLTAPGGGSRSGMCVRASGGSVAHSAAGCWSTNPAFRRWSELSMSWLPIPSKRRPGQLRRSSRVRRLRHVSGCATSPKQMLVSSGSMCGAGGDPSRRCCGTGVSRFQGRAVGQVQVGPDPDGLRRCGDDGMLRPRSAVRNGSPRRYALYLLYGARVRSLDACLCSTFCCTAWKAFLLYAS